MRQLAAGTHEGHDQVQVLYEENITYGFRRNLLGLKQPALCLNIAIVVFCLIMLWLRWPLDMANPLVQGLLSVVMIALLHATYFLVVVNQAGAVEAARTYGRQLLLSTEMLADHTSDGTRRKSK
jgi:hypothetical protein